MSLNNEYRFGSLPTTKLPRSVFKMKKNFKGTFNAGDIIPFYVRQIVVPGSTYQIKQSIVCRMLTPIYPTMDDLVLDVYFFADSWRRNWDNFKKFMGENTNGAWVQSADLEVPQVQVPVTASGTGIPECKTLWDYMGLAKGIKGYDATHPVSVSALPFRMYCEIYNYFFRNQNLIAPIATPKGDSNINYNKSLPYAGGLPLKASKLPSYFSTSLPEPQKANPVRISLGTSAPVSVFGTGKALGLYDGTNYGGLTASLGGNLQATVQNTVDNVGTTAGSTHISTGKVLGVSPWAGSSGLVGVADLTNATAATLNALRLDFQTQIIYERDGQFGTRYFDEILYGHYGTTSGAAKYEKPTYIGGKRIPLQMNQVAQTADTANNVLGATGAFSLTADVDYMVNQSFTEHTIIMGVFVVRQLTHTSQNAIPRQWSIKKRLDMWWHEYDHLGNQPVYNKEIYADGSATDNQVFGYQERYAEYRYEENTIAGEFNSSFTTPLDAWHYGDYYSSLPVLSQSWVEETPTNIQRSLAVKNHDQFMIDTTLYIKAIQPLPVFGNPGYADHF